MKIIGDVEKIIDSYELKPIDIPKEYKNVYDYLRDDQEREADFSPVNCTEDMLFEKYRQHIPRGWYGFAIGLPVVPVWLEIIDKILEVCIKADSNFEINQIKMKFGGIRFYVYSEVIEDMFDVERLIENTLFDEKLIY